MKTYYCVTTRFFDNGTVKANLYEVKAVSKPENTMTELKQYDEYHDYFDTYNEALQFYKMAKIV